MSDGSNFSLIQAVMNPVERWSQPDQNFFKRELGTRFVCFFGGIPTAIASTVFHSLSLVLYKAPGTAIKTVFRIENSLENFTGSHLREAAKKTAYFAASIFVTAALSLGSPTRLLNWYYNSALLLPDYLKLMQENPEEVRREWEEFKKSLKPNQDTQKTNETHETSPSSQSGQNRASQKFVLLPTNEKNKYQRLSQIFKLGGVDRAQASLEALDSSEPNNFIPPLLPVVEKSASLEESASPTKKTAPQPSPKKGAGRRAGAKKGGQAKQRNGKKVDNSNNINAFPKAPLSYAEAAKQSANKQAGTAQNPQPVSNSAHYASSSTSSNSSFDSDSISKITGRRHAIGTITPATLNLLDDDIDWNDPE